MSYTDINCMEYFTPKQGERMRNAIATLEYLKNVVVSCETNCPLYLSITQRVSSGSKNNQKAKISLTANNIIEYNEVHDCLKRLHDGNAIYLSAHGNGNIIRKNVTYNHPEGALIRTDDDSHNVTVTENICIGSKEPMAQGLCLKGLNFFENNLLFNSMLLTGSAGNTADIRSSYQKNIVYFSKKDSVFHQRLNMFSENLNKKLDELNKSKEKEEPKKEEKPKKQGFFKNLFK